MKKRSILISLWLFLSLGCAGTNKYVVQKDVQARLDLAQSFLLKSEPRAALIELQKIESQARDIPFFYFLKGMIYLKVREFNKAVRCFNQAISINPRYGDAWNNLGITYLAEKKEDKAVECFKKAMSIESYPTPEYAAHNLALIYKKRGELEKAISLEKKALILNWRYLPSYLSIADLYVKKGDVASAILWLKKGIHAFPDNLNLYFLLGENYLRSGDETHAKECFTRIIELDKKGNSRFTKMARDYLDIY